ncbi:MAG TPA: branched-chain amino acid ABC transporter permease [Acidimicrobiales bacterium]|nr:branched-chain amino acid ABC transporter permease [Acidimicrobiales bacterium]
MIYVTALISGVATGCLYALIALGYNLVYSATSVFNFAQGDLVSLGGLFTYSLIVTRHWTPLAVVIPVVVLVAVVGLFQERLSIAPLTRHGDTSLAWVITTLGASVILENVFQLVWGSTSHPVPALISGGPIMIGRSPLTYTNAVIIGAAVVCAVGLELWSRLTLTGQAWRATSEDSQAAQIRGINVRRVAAMSFVLAGVISGLAGFVTVPQTSAAFDSGSNLALFGFVAIAIGGFGNQLGALVGGVILGVVEAEALLYASPNFTNAIAMGALLLVLLLRPTGLLGYRREREV